MRFAKCGWRRGFTSNKTPQIGSKESQKEGKARQGKARSLIVQYEKSIEIWYEPDRFPALQPPTSYLLQPIVTQLCYPGISFQVLSLKKLSWLSIFETTENMCEFYERKTWDLCIVASLRFMPRFGWSFGSFEIGWHGSRDLHLCHFATEPHSTSAAFGSGYIFKLSYIA